MSVDAFLTYLGRSLPKRSLYRHKSEWQAACWAEEAFLRQIESRLTAQCDEPVALVGSILDGTLPPGGEASDLEIVETVGGTDGIAPIQALVLSILIDGTLPQIWRFDDPYEPLRRARELSFRGELASFRHLLDHDPVMGYYLPLDFPEPIWMPGEARQESRDIAVGSAVRLLAELERWVGLSTAFADVPQWLVNHAENLADVSRAALQTELAVEIA